MRILVVDDNYLLATILADHLQKGGHEVDAAFDGERALRFCEQSPYEMLVVDLMLPGLDGRGLVERLRKECQTCRVVVITGVPELLEQELPRLQALGVVGVIRKPFSFSEVDEIVARVAAGDD